MNGEITVKVVIFLEMRAKANELRGKKPKIDK